MSQDGVAITLSIGIGRRATYRRAAFFGVLGRLDFGSTLVNHSSVLSLLS